MENLWVFVFVICSATTCTGSTTNRWESWIENCEQPTLPLNLKQLYYSHNFDWKNDQHHRNPITAETEKNSTLKSILGYLSYFYYFSCPTNVLVSRAYPSNRRRTIHNGVVDHNLIRAEKNTSPRKNTKCEKAQVGEKSRSAKAEDNEIYVRNISVK